MKKVIVFRKIYLFLFLSLNFFTAISQDYYERILNTSGDVVLRRTVQSFTAGNNIIAGGRNAVNTQSSVDQVFLTEVNSSGATIWTTNITPSYTGLGSWMVNALIQVRNNPSDPNSPATGYLVLINANYRVSVIVRTDASGNILYRKLVSDNTSNVTLNATAVTQMQNYSLAFAGINKIGTFTNTPNGNIGKNDLTLSTIGDSAGNSTIVRNNFSTVLSPCITIFQVTGIKENASHNLVLTYDTRNVSDYPATTSLTIGEFERVSGSPGHWKLLRQVAVKALQSSNQVNTYPSDFLIDQNGYWILTGTYESSGYEYPLVFSIKPLTQILFGGMSSVNAPAGYFTRDFSALRIKPLGNSANKYVVGFHSKETQSPGNGQIYGSSRFSFMQTDLFGDYVSGFAYGSGTGDVYRFMHDFDMDANGNTIQLRGKQGYLLKKNISSFLNPWPTCLPYSSLNERSVDMQEVTVNNLNRSTNNFTSQTANLLSVTWGLSNTTVCPTICYQNINTGINPTDGSLQATGADELRWYTINYFDSIDTPVVVTTPYQLICENSKWISFPSNAYYLNFSVANTTTVGLDMTVNTFLLRATSVTFAGIPVYSSYCPDTLFGPDSSIHILWSGSLAAGNYQIAIELCHQSGNSYVDVCGGIQGCGIQITGPSQNRLAINAGQSDENTSTGYKIKVLPNPSSGVFEITPGTALKTLVVFDLSGRKIKSFENIIENKISLDLSELKDGVYLLETKGENFTVRQKIVLQR